MTPELDALVIGAGAAGLSACSVLSKEGLNVLCLEARSYVGGRIRTVHDPLSPVPIELGAEFVHGVPPQIMELTANSSLSTYECDDSTVYSHGRKIQKREDIEQSVDQLLSTMQEAGKKGDQSFAEFLKLSRYPLEIRRWAELYVEGFNAAHKETVGIASLSQDQSASDEIDGDRLSRLADGYDAIPRILMQGIESRIRLNSVVEAVEWNGRGAIVRVRSPWGERRDSYRCRRLIITVPLGVLMGNPGQPGSIRFTPPPKPVLDAGRNLRFGQVVRVTLRFESVFWDDTPELAETGLILSRDAVFPTWWTRRPMRAPILTGWSAGPRADGLSGKSKEALVAESVAALRRVLHRKPPRVEAAYVHNWHADPFARGAYSYAAVGGVEARQKMAEPVGVLYFAGEATDTEGHSATVHGAIATGQRAARQVLESLR